MKGRLGRCIEMRYALAGHTMIPTPHGDACELCHKTWQQMLNEREYWKVGQGGVAHVGNLNESEVKQLNDRLEKIWEVMLP
jgi:hypothetical protein